MDPLVLTVIGQLLGAFVTALGVWPTVVVVCCTVVCGTCAIAFIRAERYNRYTDVAHDRCIDQSERFAKMLLRPILLKLKGLPPSEVDVLLDEMLAEVDEDIVRTLRPRSASRE